MLKLSSTYARNYIKEPLHDAPSAKSATREYQKEQWSRPDKFDKYDKIEAPAKKEDHRYEAFESRTDRRQPISKYGSQIGTRIRNNDFESETRKLRPDRFDQSDGKFESKFESKFDMPEKRDSYKSYKMKGEVEIPADSYLPEEPSLYPKNAQKTTSKYYQEFERGKNQQPSFNQNASKYDIRKTRHSVNDPFSDYTVKHSRRNDEIISRMQRQQRPVQQFDRFEGFRKDRQNQEERNDYFDSLTAKFPQQGELKGMNYGQTNYYQREKEGTSNIQPYAGRFIEKTPQKMFRPSMSKFEPGSADKKKSLIEKSQILQQKLKKLNVQNPISVQATDTEPAALKTPQSFYEAGNIRSNSKYDRYVRAPQMQTTTFNKENDSNLDLIKSVQLGSKYCQGTKKIENEQAINKIAQLNEKINERIQSIISNFGNNK